MRLQAWSWLCRIARAFRTPTTVCRQAKPTLELLEGRWVPTATLAVGVNANISQLVGNQSEPTIAINPRNPLEVFAASNQNESPGIMVAYSSDGGATWTSRVIADGSDGFERAAGDGQAIYDQFGNLFLTYLRPENRAAGQGRSIELLVSPNNGRDFRALPPVRRVREGELDQPSLAVGPGLVPGEGSVWITYREKFNQVGIRGARVTGLDQIDPYGPVEVARGSRLGNFGHIAVGPAGQVFVTYQVSQDAAGPGQILGNLDPDGLGPARLGDLALLSKTQIGDFRPLPAQPNRTIDAEANLAWDMSGRHQGRLYVVYTDAANTTTNDTDIFLRYSDTNGNGWSNPVRVVDDVTGSSQFFPYVSVDPGTGNVAVSWVDARDSVSGKQVATYATISEDGGNTFLPNVRVSAGFSDATINFNRGNEFGDYTYNSFVNGRFFPIWTDNGTALAGNADRPKFEIATAPVQVGPTDSRFYVQVPLTAPVGTPVEVTVVALDAQGHPDPSYRGQVKFSSQTLAQPALLDTYRTQVQGGTFALDATTTLPADYTFTDTDQGRHTFQVTFTTAATHSLAVRDSSSTSNVGVSGLVQVASTPAATPRQIVGKVFADYSGEGAFDLNEPTLAAYRVHLDLNNNGLVDANEPTTSTDGAGNYRFTNLAPGSYTLRPILTPGSRVPSEFKTFPLTLTGQHDALHMDLGVVVLSPVATLAVSDEPFGDENPDYQTAFISGLYHQLLGRSPDPVGSAGWLQILRATNDRSGITAAIWQSPEHRGRQVDGFYRDLLGRTADPVGRQGWINVLLSGSTEAEVTLAFVTSAEFQKASDHATYVSDLYYAFLGRTASQPELTLWSGAIQAGVPRSEVARQILYSSESLSLMVRGLYNVALQRDADPLGLHTWVTFLNSEIQPRSVFQFQAASAGSQLQNAVMSIYSSPEFIVIAAAHTTDADRR